MQMRSIYSQINCCTSRLHTCCKKWPPVPDAPVQTAVFREAAHRCLEASHCCLRAAHCLEASLPSARSHQLYTPQVLGEQGKAVRTKNQKVLLQGAVHTELFTRLSGVAQQPGCLRLQQLRTLARAVL